VTHDLQQPFHLEQTPQCITLRFPMLRAPAGPLLLGAFGAVAMVLSGLAVRALIAAGSNMTYDLLALALLGTFAVPFLVFGGWFMIFAGFALLNTLEVNVRPDGITSEYRLLGLRVGGSVLVRAAITEIDIVMGPRYRNVLGGPAYYQLVVRRRDGTQLYPGDGIIGEDAALALKAGIEDVLQLTASAAGTN